ncbi:polysaccharide biosynthesis protein [Calidifontibacillus oryziterrae]|uniref:polysaccharide biosynthesis protein n=1 Tax=Calidifontibacillus oryziterrae TaxID=1191699 RepID=UPI00031ABBA9|nr:nucleoside-diphosphate sugar epimerase/dehydratase [Calidifontibacillus oryziterrae]
MHYKYRLLGLITIDSLIVVFSIYMSHFFLNPYRAKFDEVILISSILLLLSHHVFSYFLGLYRRAWRYASLEELFGIIVVVSSSILLVAAVQAMTWGNVYERALIITWMVHVLLIGGVRFAWRYYNLYKISFKPLYGQHKRYNQKRTLIIGAGSAGRMLARQLRENPKSELSPVAFLDDDLSLQKLKISGINVYGLVDQMDEIVSVKGIEHIIIAMPSVNRKRIGEIVTNAKRLCKNVQILPMIEDLVLGNISVNQIRDVSIEDLLGREPVKLDTAGIASQIQDKTILVTGAGGSIGSELCRQLSLFNPSQIILLGHGENSIYNIELELKKTYKHIEYPTVIADVQDRKRIFEVFEKYKPSFVFHAAAHKHVPLMECNPAEAVKNNIFGTRNVAEAADAFGVNTFVLVSSDKAVNPTNVMGSTKRFAEIIIQDLAQKSSTKFVAVRFGNVLGSRGSVVPVFQEQIRRGGPVTVTHPDMTRYFMTIPEASRLVIQAGALARGGEIFVLDMGDPVKIVDLARNLIRLSGFTEEEIKIEFTGIRPGEKMYEELLNESEIYPKQVFPKIFIGKASLVQQQICHDFMERFVEMPEDEIRTTLLDIANNRIIDTSLVANR